MLVQNSIYLDLAINRFPLTVAADSLVLEAISLMRSANSLNSEQSGDHRFRASRSSCVLVVNENKLIGIFVTT
jgi:CBS domain-containing protein